MNNPSMVVHELLRWWIIQTNECKSADSVKINISLSFTRYSDGKIIEHQLDDNGIQEVHKIFFDTSLILDILEQQLLCNLLEIQVIQKQKIYQMACRILDQK